MTVRTRRLLTLGLMSLWVLAPVGVSAQGEPEEDETSQESSADDAKETEARKRFRLGRTHYKNGDFAKAAKKFEQAYDLSPRPELLFNMYIAHRDAQNTRRAVEVLEKYLDEASEVRNRGHLEARLAAMKRALEQQQGAETEDGAPGAEADDKSKAEREPAGDVESEEKGSEEKKGQGETTAQPKDEDEAGAETDARPGKADSGTAAAVRSDGEDGGAAVPISAITVGSAGAAMLLTGAVTGGMALKNESDLQSACPNDTCALSEKSTRDRARRLALTTDVLLATGGVAFATGVALFFVLRDDHPGEARTPKASLQCGPTGCRGSVSVNF